MSDRRPIRGQPIPGTLRDYKFVPTHDPTEGFSRHLCEFNHTDLVRTYDLFCVHGGFLPDRLREAVD
jgi:hypothetical protein